MATGRKLTPFVIARQNMRRRPFRTFCLMGLVALLACVLSAGSLLTFGLRSGLRSISDRLGADLMLVPRGYEQSTEGALLRGEPSTFYLDGALAAALAETDGLVRVSPQLFIATLDSDHCAFPVQLIGYDPGTDFVIAPWLARALPGGPADGEIVIGHSVSARVGEELLFFSQKYRVAGQLERTGMGFDTSVFMNMGTARATLEEYVYYTGAEIPDRARAVSTLTADVDAARTTPQEVARKIRDVYRNEGVGVILTQAMIGGISDSLNAFLTVVAALVAVLWLLAAGVLMLMFSVTLHERRREFGLYRALGATRGRLVRIVLTESSLLSLAGACAGVALLCLLLFPFQPLIARSVAAPYLQPSAAAAAALLGASLLLSFLTGPLASARAAASIGRVAAHAAVRGGE
ncbi:MAG: ABC transporter permease [Oscillospiraceae bacterium]|jgi:putative ABC transport system permease protein|nr:ABC transporter permease [Oscillospiraceae bacterium]